MCERNGSERSKIYIVAVFGVRFDLEFPPKSFLVSGEKFHWGRKAQHTICVSSETHFWCFRTRSVVVANRGEENERFGVDACCVLTGTSLNNWHLFPARKSWNTIHDSHLITLCRLACSQKRSVYTWNRGKVLLLFTWKTLSMLDWEYSSTLLLSPGELYWFSWIFYDFCHAVRD